MKVSVSILSEKDNIKNAINKLNNTDCDYIHLDIMDSTFTDSSSYKLEELSDIKTNKKYDIHIMSTNLDYQIDEAIKLNPEFITIHYEATIDIIKYIVKIKKNNIKVGIAINPSTSVDDILPIVNLVDLVLVMSVNPGLGGQEFIDITSKLIRLKEMNYNYLISVDGGINGETIKLINKYVDIVVSGSFITNSSSWQENINILKNNK